MAHDCFKSNPRRRRGAAGRQTLGLLCLLAGTVLVGYVAGPGLVQASDSARQQRAEQRQMLVTALNAVSSAVSRCRAVLAMHPRGETPYVDIVLWMTDDRNPGAVDPEELALLSHSRALGSIRLFTLAHGRGGFPDLLTNSIPVVADTTPFAGHPDSPEFGDLWRSSPHVNSTILADRVSDLSVEIIRSDDGGHGAMRIELICTPESADWAERASVVIRLPSASQGDDR